MTEYTNRQIREGLRKKAIPVTRTLIGAKFQCRRRFRRDGNPQWAFAENYGFVILDKITVQLFNHARMKNGIRILRNRHMDQMCVFRHPRKGWCVFVNPERKKP